jgi:hypothetical protein
MPGCSPPHRFGRRSFDGQLYRASSKRVPSTTGRGRGAAPFFDGRVDGHPPLERDREHLADRLDRVEGDLIAHVFGHMAEVALALGQDHLLRTRPHQGSSAGAMQVASPR